MPSVKEVVKIAVIAVVAVALVRRSPLAAYF